ncbi:hypothetical protein J437_LFUL010954 [Ladona fulva]|uniref:Uncharacterized protein n=1 Tax=Ladona fulva TaxID=123851 RepID=A0A8K0KFM4_LADFU|nr:hypothetical protein J437_LFUL010954 [Ladona fulva]
MQRRYGEDHLRQVHRLRFRSRIQQPGESLQAMESNIRRLALFSYPHADPEFLEELQTDTFINAIRDRELQQAVRLSGKNRSSDALIFTLANEAGKQTSRRVADVREASVIELNLDAPEVVRQAKDTLQGRGRGVRDVSRIRCWGCGRSGHLQRNSWSNGRRRDMATSPSRSARQGNDE